MTDIMDSQAVKAAAAASAANAAQPSAHQPLRTAVVKAAELARAAEERALDKQHAKGKKTARERLDLLFDTGTFEEIGRFQGGNIAGGNAGAAVITGFGQVYGRKVAVYAQDFSVKGGTLGTAEGEKICRLMDMAIDLKVPIVAIVDSGGARIQEGVAALTQYGRIFRKTCEASGFVPQLSLILGPCAGGAVYCPALTWSRPRPARPSPWPTSAAAKCTTGCPAWPTTSARTNPTPSTMRAPCSPTCRPTAKASRRSTPTPSPAPNARPPSDLPPSCPPTNVSPTTCSK